jgi:hypothetical protein
LLDAFKHTYTELRVGSGTSRLSTNSMYNYT